MASSHQNENLMFAPEPESDNDDGNGGGGGNGNTTSMVMRVGFVAAGGVLVAIACSMPAALRMGEEGGGIGTVLERWLVLSALATPAGVAAVALLRRARVGLRLLVGDHALILAMGVLWWSVIELGLLAVFGALLRKMTHQQSLAGVTFAAFAIFTGLIVGLFARRATRTLARGGSSLQKVGLVIAGGAAFVVLLIVGIRTSRAEGMHTASALVDTLAFAVIATIASSRLLARVRALAIAGVPVAVLVIMIGFTTLRFDAALRASLAETAPMHAFVLDFFGR